MKLNKRNLFIAYAIDEATSSNDWLTRYENQTKAELRKRKNYAKLKRTQERTA